MRMVSITIQLRGTVHWANIEAAGLLRGKQALIACMEAIVKNITNNKIGNMNAP